MLRRLFFSLFFFFNDTATTEIYTLSLHDALPIYPDESRRETRDRSQVVPTDLPGRDLVLQLLDAMFEIRSEEHTSELQSQSNLVCRLLLEKKKKLQFPYTINR